MLVARHHASSASGHFKALSEHNATARQIHHTPAPLVVVALDAAVLTQTALLLSAGGYFVAIMLVFLGSLVGLRLPGLFSGGEEAAAARCTACCARTWHSTRVIICPHL